MELGDYRKRHESQAYPTSSWISRLRMIPSSKLLWGRKESVEDVETGNGSRTSPSTARATGVSKNESSRSIPKAKWKRQHNQRAPNMSLNISPDQEQANFELYCA